MTHVFRPKNRLSFPQAGLSQALNFADGQLCASITYRREIPQKVTTIFKISKKISKTIDSEA